MSVIVTRVLTRRYGRHVAVDGLNLDIPEGTLFGFLGPNGSGKSTTIRVLLGLLRPSGGSASIFGLDCWRDSHRVKRDVGYLPGDLRLYPWLTCRSAVRMVGQTRGCDLTEAGARLADEFDLELDVRVRAMSSGMRQKLGLILALAHRPKLLVLDEPTTGLDPLMQDTLRAHLRTLAAAGHTVFFSSHTLSDVERLCDRVAILRKGRLVADETLDALRKRATRSVMIRWKAGGEAEASQAPRHLAVHDRHNRQWQATLTGPVMELVRWSARQPIDDISIGQPDLSHLFHQFYSEPEEDE